MCFAEVLLVFEDSLGFIMDLPDGIWIDEKTGKTAACRVMAVKAYSRTQAKFWYVFDFTIISHADRCDLQLPVRRVR